MRLLGPAPGRIARWASEEGFEVGRADVRVKRAKMVKRRVRKVGYIMSVCRVGLFGAWVCCVVY